MRALPLLWALVAAGFLDELASGVFAAVPDIEADMDLSHAGAMAVVFGVPGAVALVVEPALLVFADAHPALRQRLVVVGLLGMALALVGAAFAPGPVALAAALGLAFVANGLGVNLAQATMVEAAGDASPRWLTRWVAAGTLGDLAGPLALAAAAVLGVGWRGALLGMAALLAAHALVLATGAFPEPDDDDDDAARAPLREVLSRPAVWGWVAAVGLCGLLDETFVALASAWLAARFGASLALRGLILGGATAGGIAGLAGLDRALAAGQSPRRLLAGFSAATLLVLGAWMSAPDLFTSTVLLVLLEGVVAPLYPLAQAEAFRALPGRAPLIEAMQGLLSPLDWALPVVLGAVADRWGLPWAFAALALQPVGLWLAARYLPDGEAP